MKPERRPRKEPVTLTWLSWRTLVVAGCQAVLAWLMAAGGAVYAPIPMFAAAVLAGFLYRNRPTQAASESLVAGLLAGPFTEWAFFSVRLANPSGTWSQTGVGEAFGLAVAELALYAALLSFFAAFISWGTAAKTAPAPVRASGRAPASSKDPVPFQPEEESGDDLSLPGAPEFPSSKSSIRPTPPPGKS